MNSKKTDQKPFVMETLYLLRGFCEDMNKLLSQAEKVNDRLGRENTDLASQQIIQNNRSILHYAREAWAQLTHSTVAAPVTTA